MKAESGNRKPDREASYVLICVRGGRLHYVTGERADEGKWTQFIDRARKFSAAEAKIAKGASQAVILPLRPSKNFHATKTNIIKRRSTG